MTIGSVCSRCGSENVEPGTLVGSFDKGHTLFRPTNKRFFTLRAGADVHALACMDCGSVTISIDAEAVKGLLKEQADTEPSPVEAIECLSCGATIDAGESQCPKCGWTYAG